MKQIKSSSSTVRGVASVLFLATALSHANAQELPSWTISTQATEYGADAGDLFEAVRYGRLFPDGQVVVADARGLFVRVYGADGKRTAAFGRKGGGPGEFSAIMGLWLTRESKIAVWDGRSRRVTRFERDGRVVSTTAVKQPAQMLGSMEIFVAALRSGDLLLASLHLPPDRRPPPGQIVPETWFISRFSANGEFRAAVGQIQGMFRTHRTPLPFTPVPRFAAQGDSVWIAEGYEGVLKLWNTNGAVVRNLELPWRVRVSDQHWSQLETKLRELKKTFQLELINEVPRLEQAPVTGGMLTDERGNIWVKEFDPTFDSIWLKSSNALEPAPGGWWRVMNPAGRWIARVRVPAHLIPLDIAGNRLLGIARDELDVEHVVVYTITRS